VLRRIPKWLYVVLAVACFVGFHQFAKILQNGQGTGGIGFMAAHWAQYIFPGVLLLAALLLGRGDVEKTKAGRRSGAVQRLSVAYGTAAENSVIKVDPFRRMSQEAFQELITEFFVKNGFAVDPVPAGLGDGVDLMLRKNGKVYVAQYRHWREMRVGVPMVREQYTVMQAARANGVYVITAGEFTYKAIQYAEEKNISLIDGLKLRRLVNKAQRSGSEYGSERAPLCPLCAAEMLVRTGADQAGNEKRFWSCSNYPQCTGSREFKKS